MKKADRIKEIDRICEAILFYRKYTGHDPNDIRNSFIYEPYKKENRYSWPISGWRMAMNDIVSEIDTMNDHDRNEFLSAYNGFFGRNFLEHTEKYNNYLYKIMIRKYIKDDVEYYLAKDYVTNNNDKDTLEIYNFILNYEKI